MFSKLPGVFLLLLYFSSQPHTEKELAILRSRSCLSGVLQGGGVGLTASQLSTLRDQTPFRQFPILPFSKGNGAGKMAQQCCFTPLRTEQSHQSEVGIYQHTTVKRSNWVMCLLLLCSIQVLSHLSHAMFLNNHPQRTKKLSKSFCDLNHMIFCIPKHLSPRQFGTISFCAILMAASYEL